MTSRIPPAFGLLVSVLLLASCASSPPAPAPAPKQTSSDAVTGSDAPIEPKADAKASDAPSPPPRTAADLDCSSIITTGTVDALTAAGWTSQRQDLEVGGTVLETGLLCLWADFSVPSDHGQMYGWGAIDDKIAKSAQSALQRDGWLRSDDNGSIYFTEDPAYALATDEDGFGMTYEFGDGWVRFADTKQGLLLIDLR